MTAKTRLKNTARYIAFLSLLFSANLQAALGPEAITSGSLANSAVRYNWDAVPNANLYRLKIGSSSGATDIFQRTTSNTTYVAHGLPTDGSSLYAQLWAKVNGSWVLDSTHNANAAPAPLLLNVGSNASSMAHVFSWSNKISYLANRIQVRVGTLANDNAHGTRTVFHTNNGTIYVGPGLTTVSGLPLDGSDLWVTLRWHDGSQWRRENPERFIAGSGSRIIFPAVNTTLLGASAVFDWHNVAPSASDLYRLDIGTTANPTTYGRYNALTSTNQTVVGLPLDSSPVQVRLQYRDSNDLRWYTADLVNYTAAPAPTSSLWGSCTTVGTVGPIGRRVRTMPASYFGPIGPPPNSNRGMMKLNGTAATQVLRDNCASDTNYVSPDYIDLYTSPLEKGVYLWLAPDSGAAEVSITSNYGVSGGPFVKTYAIHPSQNVASPIFLRFQYANTFYRLDIVPLDASKPVQLSELRVASANQNVTPYRKMRFLIEPGYFVAMSGDARARVTGEIASIFGATYVAGEGRYPNPSSCGHYKIIDATWQTNQGVIVDTLTETIWINWQLASNAAITTALQQSVQAGVNHGGYYYTCTPATASQIGQNWTAKAQQAANGTYTGPTLVE